MTSFIRNYLLYCSTLMSQFTINNSKRDTTVLKEKNVGYRKYPVQKGM